VEALWFRAEHREVMVTPDHDFGADVVARMVFAISLSVNAASYVYSYEGSNYDFAGGPLFNHYGCNSPLLAALKGLLQ
jgi:hypothetical protein